jgi:hypothetical protein
MKIYIGGGTPVDPEEPGPGGVGGNGPKPGG